MEDGCKLSTRIVVDRREKASGVPEILASLGARIEYAQLEVGDYILSPEVAVERKAVRDLFSSIFDGRLFTQCSELAKGYPKPFLLIEGDPEEVNEYIGNPRVYYGALVSIILESNLKLLYASSVEETALALSVLADHTSRERKAAPLIQKPRKSVQIGLQQLYMVTSLPSVGEKTGLRLLKTLHTPRAVFTASATQLARIPGVGMARALKIKKALNTPFKLQEESVFKQDRLADSI